MGQIYIIRYIERTDLAYIQYCRKLRLTAEWQCTGLFIWAGGVVVACVDARGEFGKSAVQFFQKNDLLVFRSWPRPLLKRARRRAFHTACRIFVALGCLVRTRRSSLGSAENQLFSDS